MGDRASLADKKEENRLEKRLVGTGFMGHKCCFSIIQPVDNPVNRAEISAQEVMT
jgi:hypothetical protein